MNTPKIRIIFDDDNYIGDNDEIRNAAIEMLESYEPEKEDGDKYSDNQISQEISFIRNNDYEEISNNLDELFEDGYFIAIGTCGRWTGTYDGGKIFSSRSELMEIFKDCDYMKLWDENGHLYVQGEHHDGTNKVEIKKLTNRGYERYQNWNYSYNSKKTEREIHRTLFSNSCYSVLPNMVHNLYGAPRREYEATKIS